MTGAELASPGIALLDEPAARAARLVALSLLETVANERARLASADGDAEALHDFRVALRRLRSWLRAMRPVLRGSVSRGARRRLRRIARESNAGRDAEVLLGWLDTELPALPPRARGTARWLRERFERQRVEAGSSLAGLLARDFERARARLAKGLERYWVEAHVRDGIRAPAMAAVLADRLGDHASTLREYLPTVATPTDADAAHRTRLAGKRLRYLLEPVAGELAEGPALIAQLKDLQDSLGALHDAQLWLLILHEVMVESAPGASKANAGRRSMPGAAPSRGGLMVLTQLARARAADAHTRFTSTWGGGGAAPFLDQLAATREALAHRGRPATEIERKFLLSGMPGEMPAAVVRTVLQGYLPGTRLVERVRAVRDGGHARYYRTVKTGAGLVRQELEEETTRAIFDRLWPLTRGRRVEKRRHVVADGALTWEIDEFTDRALVLAEVELSSADVEVVLPEWLAAVAVREVTDDPAFLNVNLAR